MESVAVVGGDFRVGPPCIPAKVRALQRVAWHVWVLKAVESPVQLSSFFDGPTLLKKPESTFPFACHSLSDSLEVGATLS